MPKTWVKIIYCLVLAVWIPIENIIFFFKKKKDILIAVSYPTLCANGIFLGQGLRSDPRFRVWATLTLPCEIGKETREELKRDFRLIPYGIARFIKWDLIVFSNHDKPFRPHVKKIFVRHGASINKIDAKGDLLMFNEQAYEGKRLKYDMFFLESARYLDILVKKYAFAADRLRVGGDLYSQKLLSMKQDRLEVFKKYSLDPSKPTVMIISSWGRSIIHFAGAELLKALPVLLKDYNVIFSIHPKAANPTDPGYEPMTAEFLEFGKGKKDYVFSSDGSWNELVHHCDCMVTDITSASFYCLPYVKGVVYFEAPGVKIWENSAPAELRRSATVIETFEHIDDAIKAELAKDKKKEYERLANLILGDYSNSQRLHMEEISKTLFNGKTH